MGGLLTGGIGILAGTIGSNTVKITCLACGKEFKPGEGHNAFVVEENTYSNLKKASKQFIPSSKTGELNRIKCEFCETENFTNFTYWRHCGKALSECDERIHSEVIIPLHCCQSCKELTPNDGNYCPHCKSKNQWLITNIGSNKHHLNTIKCEICATENWFDFIFCIECGKILTPKDERYYSDLRFSVNFCPNCREFTPGNGKFCANCKCENIPTKIKHDGKIVLGILLLGFIYFLYWLFTR